MKIAVRNKERPVLSISPDPNDTLAEQCRILTDTALATLQAVMSDERAPASAKVTAALAILDRGHGKPAQTVHSTSLDLNQAHLDALKFHAAMKDVTP